MEVQIADLADSRPISFMCFLNFCLSSALSIASALAPINSILYFFNIPFLCNSIAALRPV